VKKRKLLAAFALAFANTAGPNLAGTGGTAGTCNGSTTFCWASPGNVTANDGVFASVTLGASGTSNELQGTNFGFAIPAGSTVNGITVEIFKKAISGSGNPTDIDVTILKAGAPTGTNLGHLGAGRSQQGGEPLAVARDAGILDEGGCHDYPLNPDLTLDGPTPAPPDTALVEPCCP